MNDKVIPLGDGTSQLPQEPDPSTRITRQGELAFLMQPEEGEYAGPFCPNCLDDDQRLVALGTLDAAFRRFGEHICPECQTTF